MSFLCKLLGPWERSWQKYYFWIWIKTRFRKQGNCHKKVPESTIWMNWVSSEESCCEESVRELPAPWPGPKLWVLRWLAVMTVGGRSLWTAGGRRGGGTWWSTSQASSYAGRPLFEEPRASPAVSLPMQVIIHLNCRHLPSQSNGL